MNDLYELMDKCLSVDKDVKSIIYVVETMEKTYSEEDDESEKYICNTIWLVLKQIEDKIQSIIKTNDEYIIKNSNKRV